MAKSLLLVHFDELHELVRELGSTEAFAFGVSCAQRQWPVYRRACIGKSWARAELAKSALDAVWEWLLGISNRPSGYADQLEAAIPDEIQEDSDGAAGDVLASIASFLGAVEDDKPDVCEYTARYGLDLLNAFVYDLLDLAVTPDNDRLVEQHQLIKDEIKRQMDDIMMLQRGPLPPPTIENLREKAESEPILGDHWYKPTAQERIN